MTSSFAQSTPQKIEKNGMTVEWKVVQNNLKITMTAPTDGWVAIGLNPKDQLAGSSFMMGRVQNGKAEVLDFYTIKPGDVHPVTKLGGQTAVGEVVGSEKGKSTSITFDLSRFPDSQFHHTLEAGSELFMHIAYSQDDDFAHHSMMRTMVKIKI